MRTKNEATGANESTGRTETTMTNGSAGATRSAGAAGRIGGESGQRANDKSCKRKRKKEEILLCREGKNGEDEGKST